jgi:hypothetical protein
MQVLLDTYIFIMQNLSLYKTEKAYLSQKVVVTPVALFVSFWLRLNILAV